MSGLEDALVRELAEIGHGVEGSTLAASALVIARRMDLADTADTAVPALARELREALDRIRASVAAEPEDRMTEFERRRLEKESTG